MASERIHVYEFRCPQCSTRLRCRDRSWVGRRIRCPDCGASVRVAAGGDGKLYAVAEEAVSARSDKPEVTKDNAAPETRAESSGGPEAAGGLPLPQRRSVRERLFSPAGIGWLVAGSAGLLLIGALTWSPGRRHEVAADPVANKQDQSDDVAMAASNDSAVTDAPNETVEDRLQTLSGWINAYSDEQGRFPATAGGDLAPGERLSWQAELLASQPDGEALQPHWDRAWDDPLNDRFVRRRIDALLNPNFDQPTGAEGYPATHFAGVAGVGADAADLPKRHPRAGIFGNNRQTGPGDVTDGLANTMLVAGVQQDLSSWAADGTGTVRPFTREPYINGPDGFGTGQADGMAVLMADGSVRFLSSDTDPTIIRRLAAMADGLPLDAGVPGEPGDSTANRVPELAAVDVVPETTLPPDPFAGRGDADVPIDVPLAPDPPQFDVAGALRFPVAEFAQSTPVSLLDLLYQWEEMAGVPIDASPLNDDPTAIDKLNQNVTLELTDTTLGEILAKLLAQAGLRYESAPNSVRLYFADPS